MQNWTSDFWRQLWNESDPDIQSPLFVPKGNWTEEDFERARNDPYLQDEGIQDLVEAEYLRLRGVPLELDPEREGDPWMNVRGEANCWGSDPLQDVEGGTPEGLRSDPATRLLLQTTLHQVRNSNETYGATEVVSLLGAVQALGIADFGREVKQMFPLRDDEYAGPQWKNATQRGEAVGLLRRSLEAFLGAELPPVNGWEDSYDMVRALNLTEALPGRIPMAGVDFEARDAQRAGWPEGTPFKPDFYKQDEDQVEPHRWDIENAGRLFEPPPKGV